MHYWWYGLDDCENETQGLNSKMVEQAVVATSKQIGQEIIWLGLFIFQQ